MLTLRNTILALVPVITSVLGQSATACDPQNGVCFQSYTETYYGSSYGFVLPLANSTTYTNEFIGQFTVPISGQWAGACLGEGMNGNLLILGWPYNGNIVFSTRQAVDYNAPTLYAGPQITTLATSINSTYWKWTFRCQNCTTWTINGTPGDVDPSFDVFGWAFSTTAPLTPSSSSSAINQHDNADLYGFTASAAQSASYGSILASFASKPSSSSSIKPSTTSTSTVHSTTSSTHSTTSTTPTSTIHSTTSTTPTSTVHSTTSTTSTSVHTTSTTPTTSVHSTTIASTTSSAAGPTQTHYGQCGGTGWTGPTTCAAPYTCTLSNAYYSQCL